MVRGSKQARACRSLEFSTLCDRRGCPCLPCHHRCWNPSGSSSPRCCRARAGSIPTIRWAVTGVASPTGWCSSTSSTPWFTARATSASPAPRCSDSTIRRRLKEWSAAGHRRTGARRGAGGLRPDHRAARWPTSPSTGASPRRPCGGDKAGPLPGRPAQRRPETLGGHRRRAGSRWASSRPAPTATTRRCWRRPCSRPRASRPRWPDDVTVHLDAGYDSAVTRALLDGLGCTARSPARAYPHRCRPASGGSASAPTAG